MGAWSVGRKAHGASLERGSKAIMKGAKTMGIYRIFYAGGSVDLGADDFNIVDDSSRVLFIRDKEYIACFVLANITGFVKVD